MGSSEQRQIEGKMDRGVFLARAEAERTTRSEAPERYIQEYLPQLKHPYPNSSIPTVRSPRALDTATAARDRDSTRRISGSCIG